MIDPDRRWMDRAACAGMPSEMFFMDHSGYDEGQARHTPKRVAFYDKARAFCHKCPVEQECRRDTVGEPYGVWGGLDPQERRAIRRKASAESFSWGVSRKRRVGSAIATLRSRAVGWQDIERLYGLNLKAVQTLYEWYRADNARLTGTVYLPGDKPQRGINAKVTDAERREILNLARSHVPQKEIARRLKRSKCTVSKTITSARAQQEETASAA